MSSAAPEDIHGALVHLVLKVPRTAATLGAVRALVDDALLLAGVTDACRGELSVALTEACTNAIVHAHGGDRYAVAVTLAGGTCVIEVTDSGVGMDLAVTGHDLPAHNGGQGMLLIRGCTDALELRSVRPHGLAVRMSRELAYVA